MPAKLLKQLNKLPSTQFLGIILVIGAIARWIDITKSSIWHDEGFTMMMLKFQPAEIVHRTGLDVHPPLYYLLAKAWTTLFGNSVLAIRSLSAILGLSTIIFGFLLVRRLFGEPTARLAALFLALGPFLVRYSQEARMYALLAFIAVVASYFLVRALQTGNVRDWIWYGVAIAAGLYTYYYVIFIIAFHWAYMAVRSMHPKFSLSNLKNGILNRNWIVANAVAVGLFLPWLPTALKQFASVQVAYWIPKVGGDTIPVTFAQFLTFTDMNIFQLVPGNGLVPSLGLRSLVFGLFVIQLVILLINLRQKNWLGGALLILFMGLTPIAVFGLSLVKSPVYVDRYFVFASIAFYSLLAVPLYWAKPWANRPKWRATAIILVCLVLLYGISNVYSQAGHRMAVVASDIQQQFTPGDELINGDFYTFFDYSYYNRTGTPNRVFVPDNFPGCCEGKSLLYDRPDLQVKNLSTVHPASGHVWMIGKTGQQDYFSTRIPANWQPVGPKYEAGYSAAQRYHVTSPSS